MDPTRGTSPQDRARALMGASMDQIWAALQEDLDILFPDCCAATLTLVDSAGEAAVARVALSRELGAQTRAMARDCLGASGAIGS